MLAIWFFILSTFVLPTCIAKLFVFFSPQKQNIQNYFLNGNYIYTGAVEVIVTGKSKRLILGGIGQSCNSVCMTYNSICSPDVSGSKYGW